MGPQSKGLEPWVVDRVLRFKFRGSTLVDAEPVLLRLVARSGSNWLEEWGLMFGVLVARTLGG